MWFLGVFLLCSLCVVLGYVAGQLLNESCQMVDTMTLNSLESQVESLSIQNATLHKHRNEEQAERALIDKALARLQQKERELEQRIGEYRQKAAELGELVATDVIYS